VKALPGAARRIIVALALMAVAQTACAADPGSSTRSGGTGDGPSSFATPFADDRVYPLFVSSEVTVGRNRLLVGLLNDKDAPVGSPKVDMHIEFFDLGRSTEAPVSHADMRWVWISRPYVGVYEGQARFATAGRWGAEVSVAGHGLKETVRTNFDVRKQSSTPALGARVPASDTPTATTARGIKKISTDRHPEPRFYTTSVAEALRSHEPFVLVFATPKFCVSQTCGPMLDNVKKAAKDFENITFIHVEPYELPVDPSQPRPVPAALQWGLPSEPWVFVVDGRGRLVAKYEGAMSPGELSAQLERLG
jgi:hypothetical protein